MRGRRHRWMLVRRAHRVQVARVAREGTLAWRGLAAVRKQTRVRMHSPASRAIRMWTRRGAAAGRLERRAPTRGGGSWRLGWRSWAVDGRSDRDPGNEDQQRASHGNRQDSWVPTRRSRKAAYAPTTWARTRLCSRPPSTKTTCWPHRSPTRRRPRTLLGLPPRLIRGGSPPGSKRGCGATCA